MIIPMILMYLWATALVLAAVEIAECPPQHKRLMKSMALLWPVLVLVLVLVLANDRMPRE